MRCESRFLHWRQMYERIIALDAVGRGRRGIRIWPLVSSLFALQSWKVHSQLRKSRWALRTPMLSERHPHLHSTELGRSRDLLPSVSSPFFATDAFEA